MAGLELVVTREQAGRTVKSLLRGELGVSAGLMGRLKRTETGLTVNGVRVFTSAVLRGGTAWRWTWTRRNGPPLWSLPPWR